MHLSVSICAHMCPQKPNVRNTLGMGLWVMVSCQIWVLATEFWSFGKAVCVVTKEPFVSSTSKPDQDFDQSYFIRVLETKLRSLCL